MKEKCADCNNKEDHLYQVKGDKDPYKWVCKKCSDKYPKIYGHCFLGKLVK